MTRPRIARRLPQHEGPAPWNAILAPPPEPHMQEGSETADIVIIGGGFAGMSAARRLLQLQPGMKIALLEAGRLAEAASGRNTGFMIDLPHDLASDDYSGAGDDSKIINLNRHAIDFARQAVAEYRIDPNYFDEVGKVNGAASDRGHTHNLSYVRHLSSLGERSEMLDAKQMTELTGSRHYQSGLYTPGTVMLQPAGYIRGLGRGLCAQRAAIYENAPATAFERIGPDWRVTTPRGAITTGRIILTNNGHLESFGYERGRLIQLFLYGSMTPELDAEALKSLGGRPRWGITSSDPMGTTMRRIDHGQGGNRIITRTCATMKSNMTPTAAGVARAAKVHQQKFDQRFPQLMGMKMEYKWAGHLCMSLNGVSVMREIEQGVFAACVQNGLGTARGTITGIGAAELACGERSDITAFFTGKDRPKRLPPQPFAEICANAVLRWKEWRAGNE